MNWRSKVGVSGKSFSFSSNNVKGYVMRIMQTVGLLAVLLAFSCSRSYGHGRRFAFTHQAIVLPGSVTELEIWNTYRFSRDYFYRRLDTRVEFEYGFNGRLMTAFYLNHEMKTYDGGGSKISESAVGLSNEWKYKFSDPAADAFGFAVYVEGTLGLDEAEVEGKLIFDKQEGPALFACNLVIEHEWEIEIENGFSEIHRELKPGVDAAFAWFASPAFSVGAEARYMNVVENGLLTHSAIFIGPSVSYVAEHFWVTLTFLPQLASLTNAVPGKLDLQEFERFQTRLLFSVEL